MECSLCVRQRSKHFASSNSLNSPRSQGAKTAIVPFFRRRRWRHRAGKGRSLTSHLALIPASTLFSLYSVASWICFCYCLIRWLAATAGFCGRWCLHGERRELSLLCHLPLLPSLLLLRRYRPLYNLSACDFWPATLFISLSSRVSIPNSPRPSAQHLF